MTCFEGNKLFGTRRVVMRARFSHICLQEVYLCLPSILCLVIMRYKMMGLRAHRSNWIYCFFYQLLPNSSVLHLLMIGQEKGTRMTRLTKIQFNSILSQGPCFLIMQENICKSLFPLFSVRLHGHTDHELFQGAVLTLKSSSGVAVPMLQN